MLIFKVWPIITIIFSGIFMLVQHFVKNANRSLMIVLFIPSVGSIILLILYTFLSLFQINNASDFVINVLPGFLAICIITILIVIPILLFGYFWKKGRIFVINFVLIVVGLYLFLYPKSQATLSSTTTRSVPASICTCFGFSEMNMYISYSYERLTYKCFGIPLSCKETVFDRCPRKPVQEDCFYPDESEL